MILIIEGVKKPLTLWGNHQGKQSKKTYDISGQEHEKFLECITDFLQSSGTTFADVTDILTVVGPGPFTAMRIFCLTITSIARVHRHIKLFSISLFEFASLLGNTPLAIQANRDEWLIASQKYWKLVSPEQVLQEFHYCIFSKPGFENSQFFVQWEWGDISKIFLCIQDQVFLPVSFLEALYLKEPNITIPVGLLPQN